jgi:Putative Flp pilus-assembly TadE/G-like
MRWLNVMSLSKLVRSNVDRQLGRNGRDGETGAVAALVAIFFGFGVLLGLGALVLDTGSLLFERRQLQSGADAAALSIARTCLAADEVNGLCPAPDVTPSSATSPGSALTILAGANATDKKSDITSVCASAALHAANPTAFPTVCPILPSPGLVQCTGTTSTAKYVEVRTSTRSGNGASTILPPILGQALAGGTYAGETVKACARVAWGAAGSGPVAFPVTFSYCDWKAQTGADPLAIPPVLGTYQLPPAEGLNPGYGAAPNTPWPVAGSQKILYSAGNGSPTSCPTWNGHVAPGNFGTLQNISCNASVVNGWVQGDTGNSVPCDRSTLANLIGTVINVPIFDCDTPTWNSFANCTSAHGSGDWYHISGYAAFYLTGYYFSGTGNDGKSIFAPKNTPCGGGDRCVSGWFTQDSLQTTIDDTGAPGFGSYVMQLAG